MFYGRNLLLRHPSSIFNLETHILGYKLSFELPLILGIFCQNLK